MNLALGRRLLRLTFVELTQWGKQLGLSFGDGEGLSVEDWIVSERAKLMLQLPDDVVLEQTWPPVARAEVVLQLASRSWTGTMNMRLRRSLSTVSKTGIQQVKFSMVSDPRRTEASAVTPGSFSLLPDGLVHLRLGDTTACQSTRGKTDLWWTRRIDAVTCPDCEPACEMIANGIAVVNDYPPRHYASTDQRYCRFPGETPVPASLTKDLWAVSCLNCQDALRISVGLLSIEEAVITAGMFASIAGGSKSTSPAAKEESHPMSYTVYVKMDTGGPEPMFGESSHCTSNCAPMWRLAGANIQAMNDKPCIELTPVLHEAVAAMERDPDRYRALSPPNGWGSYPDALEFVRWIRDQCKAHPRGRLVVGF